MSEIADRVKNIVVEKLGVEPEKVTEEAAFIRSEEHTSELQSPR